MANKVNKRSQLIKKIENHLRITSRHLVKFDTEEETLQYLIDSFRSELLCDFVGIIMNENDYLVLKVTSGGSVNFTNNFPLKVMDCSSELLTKSLTYEHDEKDTSCSFTNLLLREKISTWFTVPLIEGSNNFGFCVIGFTSAVPLFTEMGTIFSEFGKDVAVAISLSKRKEAQKQKIMGVEWLSQNLFLDSSVEKAVEKIVERAGKGTHAKSACIYLYDERENCFVFQPPSFGEENQIKIIKIEKDYVLKNHFPFLEVPGGNQLTVPLVVNFKTIGVLHVESKTKGLFTNDDYELLDLLSNHVAAMLENARLYKDEKDHKQQLHSLLEYQQSLIKETVEKDSFDGITSALSSLFSKSVFLFDPFMRLINNQLQDMTSQEMDRIVETMASEVINNRNYQIVIPYQDEKKFHFRIWPINGGGDLLGYLAIEMPDGELDELHRISIELSLNVYSVQFIKRKLVIDTKEQVKDSFINKLLVEKIEDPESIIQYASLFNWNLQNKYRVSLLAVVLDDLEVNSNNLVEQQTKKSKIWERIKSRLNIFDRDIIVANKGDECIIIVPTEKEGTAPKKYWEHLYQSIKKWLTKEKITCEIHIGIGGETKELHDYFSCYQQAMQALTVVTHRFNQLGYALFDELGAYTLLHHLKDTEVKSLFLRKHLDPLLKYSEQKNVDLFETLRVFLSKNGSIKETADVLFIHRSTLQYRIDKIQSLLEVDINDAEQRFNLMMAYKLYDLFYSQSS